MGSGVSSSCMNDKVVIIIGGGYGGIQLAMQFMATSASFYIIDPKDFFHHRVGALRAAVNPDFMPKTIINFERSFGSHFIKGYVVSVDLNNKNVTLTDGQILTYTDLVFAVGSSGPFPGISDATTVEQITEQYLSFSKLIEEAKNIVVIGGGAVGVELCGEISDKYFLAGPNSEDVGNDNKVVTLIQGKQILVADISCTFQKNILSCLTKAGVNVLLGDRVANISEIVFNKIKKQTIKLKKTSINADLVVCCTGVGSKTQANSLLQRTFGAQALDLLDNDGRIKVTSKLLVQDMHNVYAIGDCCNTPEFKMAVHAGYHADLVYYNVIQDALGGCKKNYKQAFDGMMVPVGRSRGAGSMNGWNIPSVVVSYLKGKDLFTSKCWKMMKQECP